jgi:hypothetical protein
MTAKLATTTRRLLPFAALLGMACQRPQTGCDIAKDLRTSRATAHACGSDRVSLSIVAP